MVLNPYKNRAYVHTSMSALYNPMCQHMNDVDLVSAPLILDMDR